MGATPAAPEPAASAVGTSRARFVAVGILASRITGLVRHKVVSHFLGVGGLMDVFASVLRLPNLLQNLFGDQVMAAAFVPIYSRLLAEGRKEEARRFASAILGLLVVLVTAVALLGVALAPWLIALANPGYLTDAAKLGRGEVAIDRLPLTVTAARIMFPMAGLLVLAAWAQSILNSHRRFFLSYVSPVAWNGAMIGAVVIFAWRTAIDPATVPLESLARVVIVICVGALIGGLLQLGMQLPLVLRLCAGLRPTLSLGSDHVQACLRAVGPALAGRGVVQLSFVIDTMVASLLRQGAPGILLSSVVFYNLPFAVFATSVAASELPELARAGEARRPELVDRLQRSLRQVLFLVVPSALGYLAFGWLLVGLLRSGAFGADDQMAVYVVLSAYTLGMPASAMSRLLQNAFFALGDTVQPARLATLRVAIAIFTGAILMWGFDRIPVAALGVAPDPRQPLYLGAVGLALGSAIAGWVELRLLGARLAARLGHDVALARAAARFVPVAVLTALPAAGLWWLVRDLPVLVALAVVPTSYAAVYLGVAWRRGSPELRRWLARVG